MRILIATDAFPPHCGGSGWSTYELARGLRERGHHVEVLQPLPHGRVALPYDGFSVRVFPFAAPNVPYVRNYFKNERLQRRLAPALARIIADERIDVVHAQHVLTCPPAIIAARHTATPVICTIRDYWPVCYWSNIILDPRHDRLCPGCSAARMVQCTRPRAGLAWPLALPMIPYMTANLRRKRTRLADADAIVAVSTAIAHDLRERAPEIARTRLEVIPNPLDLRALDTPIAARPVPEPYAIYVGKLAGNKGVDRLLPAVARARLPWPLVIVGDGPQRDDMERGWRASGHPVRFTGWLPRDEALSWLRHAELLIFPSHGPESLSRVLLEASALRVPVAAMNTGGTRDIIQHEDTGLLSASAEELGDDVARLVADPALRAALAGRARAHVERHFAAPFVVARVEALYHEVRSANSARAAMARKAGT